MSKINFPAKWRESEDMPYVGIYFVAVRYPTGLGTYDFVAWNGEKWELEYTAEVVGWVPVDDVINHLKAGWPPGAMEHSEEFEKGYQEMKKNHPNDDDAEPNFVEIE